MFLQGRYMVEWFHMQKDIIQNSIIGLLAVSIIILGAGMYLLSQQLQTVGTEVQAIDQGIAQVQAQPSNQQAPAVVSVPTTQERVPQEYGFTCAHLATSAFIRQSFDPILSANGWNVSAEIETVCYHTGGVEVYNGYVIIDNCVEPDVLARPTNCKAAIVYVDSMNSEAISVLAQEDMPSRGGNPIDAILSWTPTDVTYGYYMPHNIGESECTPELLRNTLYQQKKVSLSTKEVTVSKSCVYDSCDQLNAAQMTCTTY